VQKYGMKNPAQSICVGLGELLAMVHKPFKVELNLKSNMNIFNFFEKKQQFSEKYGISDKN
jgi:hypothetical protein